MTKLLYKEAEVAEIFGFSVQTLRNWRHMHMGPPYVKHGAAVRYQLEAVERFFESKTVTPEGA